nr:MAG TPA: hypothetical protein [Caudoviricetes sp.]
MNGSNIIKIVTLSTSIIERAISVACHNFIL